MPNSEPAARAIPVEGRSRLVGLPRVAAVPDFAEVYDRYLSFVWSCARRMGVRESDLDDVVQEIFIVIHGKLPTLEQPESLRSWIYGIIRRTASTYHRSRRAKQASAVAAVTDPSVQYPHQPSPLELAVQSDDVKLLWSLLAKLDAPKREVFVLAELDEMTAPEIACATEVSLNTVYSRLRAARQEIEAALTRHYAQTGLGGRS